MSGKQAARIGDTVAGNVITSGSATVLIGASGGVACSTCPGGLTAGSPVNPQLGAKVLVGSADLDFALPGALPLIWQRQYSSYVNRDTGVRSGLLGPGWTLSLGTWIELDASAARVFDAGGRVISFDPLAAGGAHYSPSENLWLLRGGPSDPGLPIGQRWQEQVRWQHVPEHWKADPRCVITSGEQRVLRVFAQAASGRFEWVLTVDPLGRRQQIHTDPHGRPHTLVDGTGRQFELDIRPVIEPVNPRPGWQADAGLRLCAVTLVHDPLQPRAGRRALVRYEYDACGDLRGVINRDGMRTRDFVYDNHRLVAHRRRAGPWHRYLYENDAPGARVIEHHNQEGVNYHFDYRHQDGECLTVVTDSLGRRNTYHFEGQGGLQRLVRHQRPDDTVVSFRHDFAGRMVARTDPMNRTTTWRLDGAGRVLGRRGPDGRELEQRWDPVHGQRLALRSPSGALTQWAYDRHARLERVQEPDGRTTRYHYPDPSEHPAVCSWPDAITDARDRTRRLIWRPDGQLQSYTDCSGRSTQFRYTAWGQLEEVVDALGGCTRYRRNPLRQLVEHVTPDGRHTRFSHDAQGQLQDIVDASGTATHLVRDLWGRVIRGEQAGLAVEFAYDAGGRLTRITNQNQAGTRLTYDTMDRLVEEVGVDGRTQHRRYTPDGQLAEVHDGGPGGDAALVTRLAYDKGGLLIERVHARTPAAAAQRHTFEHDKDGQLIKAVTWSLDEQPQAPATRLNEVCYLRDLQGRITRETQTVLDGDRIAFEHALQHTYDDAADFRTATELPGPLGRIDWLTYGSGHVHGLAHDTDPLVDIERDLLHRELTRAFPCVAGPTPQAEFELDAAGRTLAQRLTRLTGFRQLDAGLPGGAGDPTPGTLAAGLPAESLERQYQYDAAGDLAAIDTNRQQTTFAYDALGRLTEQSGAWGHRAWHLDDAGNRLHETRSPGAPASADAALFDTRSWARCLNNQVDHSAQARYAYDRWGNRTRALHHDGREMRLHYDGLHRLVRVDVSGAPHQPPLSVHCTYDAFGRRLSKAVQAEGTRRVTWFGWDGDRLVHSEDAAQIVHTVYEPDTYTPLLCLRLDKSDQAPSPATGLVSGEDLPAEQRRFFQAHWQQLVAQGIPPEVQAKMPPSMPWAAVEKLIAESRREGQAVGAGDAGGTARAARVQRQFYHCDPLGTPLLLFDESGTVVWQAEFDPWGRPVWEHDPHKLHQTLRLPGQQLDEETGLHYNRHRYYDPAIGAYIHQDPLGLAGGIHLYLYPTNPNQGTDPTGLFQVYGNWCGPDWTGGYSKPWGDLTPQEQARAAPPVDALDGCCMNHDKEYDKCRQQTNCGSEELAKCFEAADRRLSRCAGNAPDTPGNTEKGMRNKWQGAKPAVRDYMAASKPKTEACPIPGDQFSSPL